MEDDAIIKKAKAKVNAKKGFYWHLIIYVVTAVFFMLMNLATSPHKLWLLPWGAALIIHGIAVFGIPSLNILTDRWEEEELEKEIEKLKDERQLYLKEHHQDLLDINEKDYIKLKEWDKLEYED